MPISVGYPPNLTATSGPKQGVTPSPDQYDTLRFCMASIKLWSQTTQIARMKFKRDYEYAEGNGKQWANQDRLAVNKQKRPALEFNQIGTQVALACGIQLGMATDYIALPRGVEDKRVGEVVSGALRATSEYVRLPRKDAHVFTDGTICGLGVWKILHNMNDAKDILWGDITVDRVNPMAFLWDPWASYDEGFQDGAFMGDAAWVRIDDFKKAHPEMTHLANPGEWLNQAGQFIGDSTLLGVGDNLRQELYDQETGMIRVITLWRKVPTKIHLMVNMDTGQVNEVSSPDDGQAKLAQIAAQYGADAAKQYGIIQQGETTVLADQQSGQGEVYANPEAAKQRLDQMSAAQGMEVYDKMKIITREARVPHWVEMVWGQILEEGKTPYSRDRLYPYIPFVSQQYQDDPESIMGIVRNLWDPQDEYNKRYSNLLAHSNSSSHSGWLNRKGTGANTGQLELMGSVPGIVVEYAVTPPSQIHPVEMSQGHFAMVQNSMQQILRISGINAEMVGAENKKAVSGRAIQARQQGGQVILKPRQASFDEARLDCAQLLLSRIQQYYPPQKLKRIIGLFELASPMMMGVPTLFSDPITGQPLPEDQVYAMLANVSNLNFDLVLKQAPNDPTERQDAFQRGVMAIEMMMKTGRLPGPQTLAAMTEMADLPSRLSEGLKRDAMMPPQQPMQASGGGSATDKIRQQSGGHESDSGGPGPGGL